ncbi:nucleotide exchange factor GrpE [Halodesulfurarchaeum sp. HSR-GB]|uniref:nucleotide exchange factor GrpE n=1 Tax=Halodesulfurarchaeum sp. HSR-GB TaxID=3074077 RepID=UPI002859CF39|nr:nucleotide exchange factor GrpE [Halodesulfurarchaeum sp. HSR-GB]MDR5657255.1 nucleotide exchange factor GrpE [Halodesulfurarchaeum sp. HSR-GB]
MSETEESPEEPTVEDGENSTETESLAGEDLVAAVAAHDEKLAESVGDLVDRVATLEDELETVESELETAEERLEHTRADFKNYKERAKRRQEEIKERATEDLVERLLEVRDNLGRALDEESGDTESLRDGVDLTRKQFDRVLTEENVERIEPEVGADVDAQRHEVMMRVESDAPTDTVASVYRPGYEMAGKILRPAQITVSAGSEGDAAEDGESSE